MSEEPQFKTVDPPPMHLLADLSQTLTEVVQPQLDELWPPGAGRSQVGVTVQLVGVCTWCGMEIVSADEGSNWHHLRLKANPWVHRPEPTPTEQPTYGLQS